MDKTSRNLQSNEVLRTLTLPIHFLKLVKFNKNEFVNIFKHTNLTKLTFVYISYKNPINFNNLLK